VHFDYTAVGHVTIDVLADGSRRPGGSAFYGALQAARLGQRALILTRGVEREIEQLLAPYRDELELEVLPGPHTTTLETSGSGEERSQRMLAWAGPIDEAPSIDTSILHLAPIARETPRRWRGTADFVGLTPQGLARDWSGPDRVISLGAPEQDTLPAGCDALVISEVERASFSELVRRARQGGAIVAVTAGHRPTTLLLPGGGEIEVPAPAAGRPREDLGAGDVFAAAFFIALREGQPPNSAADFAGAAAALRIGSAGTDGIGDRAAIDARVRAGAKPSR
jgi:hypothetical protein